MSEFAGKSTAVQPYATSASDTDVATPGKQTLAQDGFNSAGEPKATSLAPWAKTFGKFGLSAKERTQAETLCTGLIDRALSNANLGIGEVFTRYDAELREKRAEPSAIGQLAIATIGIVGEMGLTAYAPRIAIKLLMQAHIAKEPPEIPEKALEFLAAPVDVAKDAMKPAFAPAEDDKGTPFLDGVSEYISAKFQQIATAIFTMSDSALVRTIAGYDSSLHTSARYRETIEGLLKKFLASKASGIGRGYGRDDYNVERRVARVKPSGTLIYVGQRFEKKTALAVNQRPAYNGESALSLGDNTTAPETGKNAGVTHADAETGVYFEGFVEKDMERAALKTHEQKWQAEPEEYEWSIVAGYPKKEESR
jgi:hypothetical protein